MNGNRFTLFGIIVLSVVVWTAAQSADGEVRSTMNRFLFVLLTSMVLLNWQNISPLFIKKG